MRRYYLTNKEKCNAQSEAYRKTNPSKQKQYNTASRLKKYGLTQDLYTAILESQGGCCPCGATEPYGNGTWKIDHDHRTHQVRGLLCHFCNIGLGKLGDDYDEAIRRIEALRTQAERTASLLYSPSQED